MSISLNIHTVQPQLSGLLGSIQMSPDNRGPMKYSLLLSAEHWDQQECPII